jgi:CheY-like chemotaxis protein
MVDDNQTGLFARKTLLEDEGYEVVCVETPEDALARLRAEQFHLIVTDYRMPGQKNGAELIRDIREANVAVPVILLSGYTEVLGLDPSNTGADSVLQKNDHEVSQLIRAVRYLLRKPVRTAAPPSPSPRRGRRRA